MKIRNTLFLLGIFCIGIKPLQAQCGTDTIELQSDKFSYDINQEMFYVGNDTVVGFKENSAGNTSYATFTYSGSTCFFDVIFHALGEKEKRSEYELFINGISIASFSTALSAGEYELSDKFQFKYEALSLKNGDEIKVRCKRKDSTTSKAAWDKLELIPTTCAGNDVYVEDNGMLVIEMENNTSIAPLWSMVDNDDMSYIQYNGSNSFGSPQGGSLMTYKFFINNPGVYQFLWYSRNGFNAEALDAENDSWLRINGSDFYGMMGGTKVECKGDYIKVWVHNMNNWTYNNVKGEHGGVNGFNIYAEFAKPGQYTINVGGRSKGHVIDRMVMFKSGKKSMATNLSTPESEIGCIGKFLGLVNTDTIVVKKGPFPGVDHNIPGIIEAIWFDIGDDGEVYHDHNTGWEGGLKYSDNPRYEYAGIEDVEIEEDFVGYIRNGEWVSYTIGSTQEGTYDIKLNVATVRSLFVNMYLDDSYIGSKEIPSRRSWTKFYTFEIKDVLLSSIKENARLKVEFTDSSATATPLLNFAKIEFLRTDNLAANSTVLKNVQLFPVPVSRYLHIDKIPEGAVLSVYNISGSLIYTLSGSQTKIDFSLIPVGVYIVRVEMPTGEGAFYKVVKQ